jgi:phospholipid/cholesterol/gamma-HCH transport system permease protein
MKFFYHFGLYLMMLKRLFGKPENLRMYWEETVRQMASIGLGSLGIVAFVAVFMGGVSAVQTVYQLVAPYISLTVVGSIVTNSSILELGPSVTSLVLAGKIGSSIASELGYMRSSEQIDALEIMGVNSVAFLVGPKLVACLVMIPMLVVVSISSSILGGMLISQFTGLITIDQFVEGARSSFLPYDVFFAMCKAVTFAFFIASVSAYHGYHVQGGALEVGRASTKAVVYCCVLILLGDYILAELLL